MTLITTTIALVHLAFGAATAPATALRVEGPAPAAPSSPAREAAVEGGAIVVSPERFRLAPASALAADPRLYRRDI